jgi:molybdate transport system substrate-binding protein
MIGRIFVGLAEVGNIRSRLGGSSGGQARPRADQEKIKAEFDKGVLRIIAPKRPEAAKAAGAARSRVEAGETFDVAILQRPAAEELVQFGRIEPRGMTTLARSGLAVAVRRGLRKPDIGTPEAFKQALLAARSISYPDPAQGHAAGALFLKIIDRLGIAEEVNGKAKLQKRAFSESPPEDHADLGIAQPTEIFITPSFELVDLIPEELQDYDRFSWAAGVATHAKEPAAAAALVRFLTSSKAALVIKKRGMEPGAL